MVLTESRLFLPATDQTLLTSTPSTQGPSIVRATKVGPSEYLPAVRVLSVPVGNTTVGSMPQMMPWVGCFGEKRRLGLTSRRRSSRSPVTVRGGCEITGVIHRVIRFHSTFSETGTTGWMLRT